MLLRNTGDIGVSDDYNHVCRVGIRGSEFGAASGHLFLASEAKVLYAGEIEFDSEQVDAYTDTVHRIVIAVTTLMLKPMLRIAFMSACVS